MNTSFVTISTVKEVNIGTNGRMGNPTNSGNVRNIDKKTGIIRSTIVRILDNRVILVIENLNIVVRTRIFYDLTEVFSDPDVFYNGLGRN